ncbi:MAG: hypothetical protein JW751_25950 [Polyangiaceae bacterium]|nr:hypothetical protein [Polyangiaceae bacterium]
MRPERWVAFALVAAGLAFSGPVAAQDPYGPGISPGFGPGAGSAGGGGPPGKKGKKPPPPPPKEGEPELHAASGGDTLIPEGEEPTLPQEPLRISEAARQRIGSSLDPDDIQPPITSPAKRRWIPPYFAERRGEYRIRTFFPLWVDREKPSLSEPTKVDRAGLYGGLYYRRRSAEHRQDILFPVFWNLEEANGHRTTVAGPLVNRRAGSESDDWFLPFYATGRRPGGGYTLVPPLLTYTRRAADHGFQIVGPGYCRWKGGPYCDARTAESIGFGVAPFYFFQQTALKKLEAIPPLLHYYRFDERDEKYLNIWGPYLRRHQMRSEDGVRRDWEALHLLPFYFSLWGPQERHTTVLPFVHYGFDREDRSWLFVNPLFLLAKGKEGDRTFATWLYARYRGRTRFDMVTPFYWQFKDPDVGIDQRLLLPFYYAKTSPRESTHAYFPFYAHSDHFGLRKSTWVTPFVQHREGLRGWSTNIHPILYLGRNGNRSHTIVAPLFWDFVGRSERATIALPLYYRFSDSDSLSQLVGNVYYRERQGTHGLHWQLHLFPMFSYAGRPDGHSWNLFYGLAGYTRRNDLVRVRALWIPITITKGDQAAAD